MIWFDLDNSPHVPLFKPIFAELDKHGIEYIITARDFAQTKQLLDLYGLKYELINAFVGRNNVSKAVSTILRANRLRKFIKGKKVKLAFSHGSRSQAIASLMLGIKSISMNDYEYSEKHIVNFCSTFILMPQIFPETRLKDAGINLNKTIRFNGFKEEIYLPDFIPSNNIREDFNINKEQVMIVIRPPSMTSSYHDSKSDLCLKEAIEYFAGFENAKCIIVNRTQIEKNYIEKTISSENKKRLIFLDKPVDGLHLLYAADIVVSGGGTMNRESALLGTETYSIFSGKTPYVDEYLEERGRLTLIREPSEIKKIKVSRKTKLGKLDFSPVVRNEIMNLILSNLKIKKTFPVCHLLYQRFPLDPRVRRYFNALNEENIHAVIICSKTKNEKFFENWRGNLIYRIPIAKFRKNFFLTFLEYIGFTSFSFFFILYLDIKYKFKVIQVHTLPDSLIFAAGVNKLFGTKLILDMHEIFPELFIARKPRLKNSIWVKLLIFIEQLSIGLADIVITIHEPAKEIFIKRNKNLKNRIHVIMNGIDKNEIKDTTRKPTDEFIITYYGTIVKLISLTLVVKAIALLKCKMPPQDYEKLKFKLYGGGPAVEEIVNSAEQLGVRDKLIYRDFMPPDKIFNEVLKANVCILPPEKNIYSDLFYTIKLTEMVFLKIPVIATRLNTYKYYYSEDSLFFFDSGNAEQLAERIMEVFYDKELVKRKTENAYCDYNKVGWDIMKEKYKKIIKELL